MMATLSSRLRRVFCSLLAGDQARLVGCLDAQKHRDEAGVFHQLHQLGVVGKVE